MLAGGRKTQKFVMPDQTTGVLALPLISVIGAVAKCFRGSRGTPLGILIWGKCPSNIKHLVGGTRVLKLGPCK